MNRKRIGILLVVLPILIGGIAVFVFRNDQEPKKKNTNVERDRQEIVTLPEQEEAPEETEEPEEPEGAPEKMYIMNKYRWTL